jgi:hypothetical protein
MTIARPGDNEYAPYYRKYVSLVPDDDLIGELKKQIVDLRQMVAAVPSEREHYRYGPDKWSIREVVGHVIDGERVFGYRVLALSRGEAAPLPSFNENQFVELSTYGKQPLSELLAEFLLVRQANLIVLDRLTDDDLKRTGTVSGNPVSVRGVGYILAGHARHHMKILHASYGVPEGPGK